MNRFPQQTLKKLSSTLHQNKVLFRGFSLSSKSSSEVSDKSQVVQESKCPHNHATPKPTQEKLLTFDDLPGPKGLPFFGNIFDLLRAPNGAHNYFSQLVGDYGNTVKVKLLNKKYFITQDPEFISELARQDEGRETLEPARKFKVERGLPQNPVESFNHEDWNDMRQLFNIGLRPEFVRNVIIPQLTELNSEFLQYLTKHLVYDKEKDHFQLQQGNRVVTRYTFNSVVKVFLGSKMSDETASKLSYSIDDFISEVVSFLDKILDLQNSLQIYKLFKTKKYRDMEQGYETSLKRSQECIDLISKNVEYSGKPRMKELIEERAAKFNGSKDKQLYVNTVLSSFLMAGVDITARTIVVLLYRLATEKEFQEKLYQETVDVFGEPTLDELTSENGLEITPESLKKLSLCRHFADESLRLNHILKSTSIRKLSKDVVVCGVKIEKDTLVMILEDPIRYKDFVKRSTEFLPERQERGSELGVPTSFAGPFGKGARKCPGEKTASIELYFALINLARHFRLSHSNGNTLPPLTENVVVPFMDMNKYDLYFQPREHLAEYFEQLKQTQPKQ